MRYLHNYCFILKLPSPLSFPLTFPSLLLPFFSVSHHSPSRKFPCVMSNLVNKLVGSATT